MGEGLTATPALAGASHHDDRLRIEEVTGLSILALACPLGGEPAFAATCDSVFGAPPPPPGRSGVGEGGRLLGLGRDQLFALSPEPADPRVEGGAYIVDQSDAWAVLRIEGAASHALLERLCPLDIAEPAFPVGAVARTVMAHLGVIVLRQDETTWLALAPRSSALSFFHECLARWACIRGMPLDRLRAGSVNPK